LPEGTTQDEITRAGNALEAFVRDDSKQVHDSLHSRSVQADVHVDDCNHAPVSLPSTTRSDRLSAQVALEAATDNDESKEAWEAAMSGDDSQRSREAPRAASCNEERAIASDALEAPMCEQSREANNQSLDTCAEILKKAHEVLAQAILEEAEASHFLEAKRHTVEQSRTFPEEHLESNSHVIEEIRQRAQEAVLAILAAHEVGQPTCSAAKHTLADEHEQERIRGSTQTTIYSLLGSSSEGEEVVADKFEATVQGPLTCQKVREFQHTEGETSRAAVVQAGVEQEGAGAQFGADGNGQQMQNQLHKATSAKMSQALPTNAQESAVQNCSNEVCVKDACPTAYQGRGAPLTETEAACDEALSRASNALNRTRKHC